MASSLTPAASANSPNSFTQAFRSEVQLLQWTMATCAPEGVVMVSSSARTLDSAFSSTIMANIEVPADTLPVRWRTELVATMPV